jgi:hypothetical protein
MGAASSLAGAEQRMTKEEIWALFKETQSLPGVTALTDEDIAAELAAYRAGR